MSRKYKGWEISRIRTTDVQGRTVDEYVGMDREAVMSLPELAPMLEFEEEAGRTPGYEGETVWVLAQDFDRLALDE